MNTCKVFASIAQWGMLASMVTMGYASTYPAWQENIYYAAGSVVSYNGYDYRALANQTDYTGTGWNPSVGSIWGYIGPDSGSSSTSGGSSGTSTNPNSGSGTASTSSGSNAGAGCYAVWNQNTVYTGEMTASVSTKNYRANWWTQGQNPSSNNGTSGSGQPWTIVGSCGSSGGGSSTGSGSTSSSGSGTSAGSVPAGFIYSPYKDTGINMDWNTGAMSTGVNGYVQPLLNAMPAALSTVTWAFATGECGQENWGGMPANLIASNVQQFIHAGKSYIVSTGGAGGSFTCSSDSGFSQFIHTYYSSHMKGIDFDIEGGQSQSDVDNLVQRVKTAQRSYPGLRFSFTVATLGGSVAQSLGTYGSMVMQSIRNYGLSNYTINLMVMDYGSASSWNCTLGSNGLCEMGKSAIQAAVDLHNQWRVPYSQIELTPMIGGNDTSGETFTLNDANMISQFVLQNHLAGVHFWSFDRDNDCAPGSSSATCNTWGQAGTLGFTNAFLSDLHIQ